MKKIALTIALICFGFAIPANAQIGGLGSLLKAVTNALSQPTNNTNNNNHTGWKSHTDCDIDERPVEDINGAHTTTYYSNTESANNSGQNHTTVGAGAGASAKVGALGKKTEVSANASVGYTRDGETNSKKTTEGESHEVRYRCEPIKQ